jgi:hypothetical protein
MTGLVLAVMIGSLEVVPAFAKDSHNREQKHDNGRNEHRGRGNDRDRHAQGRRGYRSYGYGEGVYAPPVIYAPPPPPGIGIFLPSVIIRP